MMVSVVGYVNGYTACVIKFQCGEEIKCVHGMLEKEGSTCVDNGAVVDTV